MEECAVRDCRQECAVRDCKIGAWHVGLRAAVRNALSETAKSAVTLSVGPQGGRQECAVRDCKSASLKSALGIKVLVLLEVMCRVCERDVSCVTYQVVVSVLRVLCECSASARGVVNGAHFGDTILGSMCC